MALGSDLTSPSRSPIRGKPRHREHVVVRDGGVVGLKKDGEEDGKRSETAGRISFLVDLSNT